MHDRLYAERTVSSFVFICHVMNQWLVCHCSALKYTRTCWDTALHAMCTKVPCPKCDARTWSSRRFEAVEHQLTSSCSLFITDAVQVQADDATLSQSKAETIRRYGKRKLISVVPYWASLRRVYIRLVDWCSSGIGRANTAQAVIQARRTLRPLNTCRRSRVLTTSPPSGSAASARGSSS
jgi:hypothetical protein